MADRSDRPVSFSTWRKEMAFQPDVAKSQDPNSSGRLTGGRDDKNAARYYAAYRSAWLKGDARTRQMIDTQHGFNRSAAPAPSSGGGGGGRAPAPSAPPPAPRPNQSNVRVFKNEDFTKMYGDIIEQGKQLIEKLDDPDFLDLAASSFATKFRPPAGWEALVGEQAGLQPARQPAPYNPVDVANPFSAQLQRNVQNLPNPGGLNQANLGFTLPSNVVK